MVKSHPFHAGTGELVSSDIIQAARKTNMPSGVFSNSNSSNEAVGKLLVKHPLVKAVGFTGSTRGGTALCKLAKEREEHIPVYAEMGSINPVVALPSALKNKGPFWAAQYARSITLGAGQFCTKPGLILGIKGSESNHFIDALFESVSAVAKTCMLHPNMKTKYEKDKNKVLSHQGIKIVSSLPRNIENNYVLLHIVTIDAEDFADNKTIAEEVFGPFSILVQCDNKTQLAKAIQHLKGQLTGTILSDDESELKDFSVIIEAIKSRVGRLIFNGVPTGVDVCAAITHGGPYPATSDSKFTSVGLTAVKRWVRPVSYQDWLDAFLPKALQNANPLGILRMINGNTTKNVI